MRVLIDTNILLDYLTNREPYTDAASQIMMACKYRTIKGCMAAHSVLNLFFILRHDYTVAERRTMLKALFKALSVAKIDRKNLLSALSNESFRDFEDCVQSNCAVSYHADYIITRNEKDFTGSPIPCIAPDVFCREYLNPHENVPKQQAEQGKTPLETP